MTDDRPSKLPPSATLVSWGSRVLTLGEKVVWYHDWALDQGGVDGSYISHESMSARLGGSLTPATISKIRQRLKRLTLHEPLRRRDARNLGWVSTLPRHCIPRDHREAPTLAVALDQHLVGLAAWSSPDEPDDTDRLDARVQRPQTPRSSAAAAALGGRGDSAFSTSKRETQLPSAVREKGDGSLEPEEREERDPEQIRAEGLALIKLRLGKRLSPEEGRLVDGYLERHPDRKATA